MNDADVVIVGAGPTGLMLAGELRLAGVRPLVLERQPQIRDIPKAGGLSGQILELLRYRGELERFEAASTAPRPAPGRFPFGGMHVDFTQLTHPPMRALPLPQPQLERVLDEFARELGAEIRRGQEVVGLSQDDATVTADVRGSDGQHRVTARYLVGCDGASSRVRDMARIPFPGTTYPEVQRLAAVTVPESVTVLENGDLDVAGVGRISFGFTRTDRGEFAVGSTDPALLGLYTSEDESADYDDDEPMTLTELRDSIRRVLGVDLPLGEPTRLTRFTFHARQVERYRDGRILLAGDAAHLFPAPGVALNAGLLDSVNLGWKLAAAIHGWAPAGLLDTYHDERHLAGERTLLHTRAQVALRRGHDPAARALRELFQELLVDEQPLRRIGALMAGTDIRYPPPGPNHHALIGTFAPDLTLRTDRGRTSVAELMHTARPILLDLADRADLRETARDWQHRIDIHTTEGDHRPADALLIRPDAHIAWAATIDEPTDTAALALREALSGWFGTPLKSTAHHRSARCLTAPSSVRSAVGFRVRLTSSCPPGRDFRNVPRVGSGDVTTWGHAPCVPEVWTPVDPPRTLSDWEAAIVAHLAPDACSSAIDALRVVERCICGCSSVGFSDVAHHLVADAEAADTDGTPIWVMLFAHSEEGTLATLDVLRADSQPIQQLPDPVTLSVRKTAKWTGSP